MSYEIQSPDYRMGTVDSFADELRNACDARSSHGRTGLGDFKLDGVSGFKIDRSRLVFYDFYMKKSVVDLGCEIALKQQLDPISWASWMMNIDFYETESHAVFTFPTRFHLEQAKSRFLSVIKMFLKGKTVKFEVSSVLRREMEQT